MNENVAAHYLAVTVTEFRRMKAHAEKALGQVRDEEFFAKLDDEANSLAVIVKHMAGNMRSRWTDFFTTDGEKPDRNRDDEFVMGEDVTRAEVMARWEEGWRLVFAAIEPLAPADLDRAVFIRGERHSVVQALTRQITHYSEHIGQIVLLAKHFRSRDWTSLSIPRGRSAEFSRTPRPRS